MTTPHPASAAFDPIGGCSLETYAAICRVLVRRPRGTTGELRAALAEWGLTLEAWARIRAGWSTRIASDPDVRASFRRLYVGGLDGRDGRDERAVVGRA